MKLIPALSVTQEVTTGIKVVKLNPEASILFSTW